MRAPAQDRLLVGVNDNGHVDLTAGGRLSTYLNRMRLSRVCSSSPASVRRR